MKRDLDLIRHILLHTEFSNTDLNSKDFVTPDYDIDSVNYHIRLLVDKNFLGTVDTSTLDGENFIVVRLKSAGHDYLDAIRDTNIWNKTKQKLGNLLSSATFDIVKSTATALIKEQLGI